VRTTLETRRVHATASRPVTVDIEVTNTSDVINGISALVTGIDPTCVQLEHPVVSLFPESTGTLTVRFVIPPTFPAGVHELVLRVFSTNVDDDVVEHEILLEVEPFESATLQLRPSLVNGGSSAELRAVIINTGNIATEFALLAEEPTRQVACRVEPATVLVEPGLEAEVTVIATGKRPWFGNPIGRNIEVTATSAQLELAETGRFNQKPRVARGIITALILASIVVLWALVFWFVITRLGQQQDAPKHAGAGFVGGATELNLANVAGRIEGTVIARSNNDPLERITVEAYRERPGVAEADLRPDASVATDADGGYVFEALLPGRYELRFSAAGFTVRWCREEGTRRVIQVDPALQGRNPDKIAVVSQNCDVTMSGVDGVLTGVVAPPDGVQGVATVTVVAVVDADAPGIPGKEVQSEPDGSFVVTGLATPASYDVTVAFEGFQPQTTNVELGGGATTVIDSSSLVGQRGSITGSVVAENGQLLGGVEVTLRSGPIERTVVTPTAGSTGTGTYSFDDLETPRNYVLTFVLDGYSSATRSLELGPGAASTDQTTGAVQLVRGSGTITGRVSAVVPGQSTKAGLGGVAVRVTSDGFTAETATITGGAEQGTYTVTDIPVPGNYTVTFSANGFDLAADYFFFDEPITQTASPTLSPITADIVAVATEEGRAKGGLVVELNDGVGRRLTASASSPAGAFSFRSVPPGWYTLTFWTTAADIDAGREPRKVFLIELRAGQIDDGPYDVPKETAS
jgi:hypothetical protein